MKTIRYYYLWAMLPLLMAACKPEELITEPQISALNCSATTISARPMSGVPFTGRISIPYSKGNGMVYTPTDTILSTGVSGLRAHLVPGILSHGDGNISFALSGTAASEGTAIFAISFGGSSCNLEIAASMAADSGEFSALIGRS